VAEHVLKTWPGPFEALARGAKAFEFRRDDRSPPFALGDHLELREWEHGVPPGYVVMSLLGVRPKLDQLAEDRKLVARLQAIDDGLTSWELQFIESVSRRVEAGQELTRLQRERALQIDERS
jgi:hypothetical protein